MATTALCSTFKDEVLFGAHCFAGTVTPTGTCASGTVVSSLSAMTGITVGMFVSGTNIASGSVVASMTSSTVTLSKAVTGAISGGTITFAGDVFYLALIKPSPSGTYDGTLTNYGSGSGTPTTSNIGTDEVSNGSGYTTGGFQLTNTSPGLSGTTGIVTFAANPTWNSATFSCVAAVLYNSTARLGGVSGRTVAVYDLGGTQTVSAGSLVLACPTFDATHALVRLGP